MKMKLDLKTLPSIIKILSDKEPDISLGLYWLLKFLIIPKIASANMFKSKETCLATS